MSSWGVSGQGSSNQTSKAVLAIISRQGQNEEGCEKGSGGGSIHQSPGVAKAGHMKHMALDIVCIAWYLTSH